MDLEEDIEDLDESEENLPRENKHNIDIELLDEEITLISKFINKAESINVDAKSKALLKALEIGFNKTKELGGGTEKFLYLQRIKEHKNIYTNS